MALITLAAAVAAAGVDLRRREIPDVIPIALLLAGLVAGFLAEPPGWSSRLLGCGVAFALGAALFYAGGLGGGDVKLMSAIGLALGLSELVTVSFWTALFGALWAVIAQRRGQTEVAYAPAIAVGVLMALLSREAPLLAPFRSIV